MSWRANRLTVEVLQGDLTQQDVDAIVNAANNDLELGGGVAGAIARAGGAQIQAECRAIRPIEVGDAAITGGGKLPARFVIHAASMRLGGRTSAESLHGSTRRSLEIAAQRGLRSLAFPAVGTGIAGFPLDECARIMVSATRAYEPETLRRVVFAVFGEEADRAFEAALGR